MQRTKQVLKWLAAGVAVTALAAAVWNLPQGRHTDVVPAGSGEHVGLGAAGPDFDEQAWKQAKTEEDLEKVRGLRLGEESP